MTDLKNYRQVFPDYVQSVQLIQNELGNVVELAGSAKGFGYDVQMTYVTDPTAGSFSVVVVKGGYTGTRMTTTLTKTWGYDGTPNVGTNIHTELKLKNSGFFSAISFVSDEQIKFGLDNAMVKFEQRAKTLQSSQSQTPIATTPITPPLTNPPVTTTPEIITPSPPTTPTPPVTTPPVKAKPPPQNEKPSSQITQITVSTDKTSYRDGDTIVVTGLVKPPERGIPITLRILDSKQNLIGIDQILPAEDGSYTAKHIATGSLWNPSGIYTITVQYGDAQQANAKFFFSGNTGTTSQSEKTIAVTAGNSIFNLKYIIKGGDIVRIRADPQILSLIISTQTTSDGSLTISLPRALIDAKVYGENKDDRFIVLTNGKEVGYAETATSTDRTISIPISYGTNEVKIVGTRVG